MAVTEMYTNTNPGADPKFTLTPTSPNTTLVVTLKSLPSLTLTHTDHVWRKTKVAAKILTYLL